MAIKRITGGTFFRNTLGFEEASLSEFLMDEDSSKMDLPVDKSVAVGSQALKLNENGNTEVYIFGPSRKWYSYNGVSFLS